MRRESGIYCNVDLTRRDVLNRWDKATHWGKKKKILFAILLQPFVKLPEQRLGRQEFFFEIQMCFSIRLLIDKWAVSGTTRRQCCYTYWTTLFVFEDNLMESFWLWCCCPPILCTGSNTFIYMCDKITGKIKLNCLGCGNTHLVRNVQLKGRAFFVFILQVVDL